MPALVALDVAGGPANLDAIDKLVLAQSEVQAIRALAVVAVATVQLADLLGVAADDRDPRADRVAVAVGAVIRGETPHFEYISAETARGLREAASRFSTPVGFGVLTCDTMKQALERAGGDAGNKGEEAAQAAVDTARALHRFDSGIED